MPPPPSTPPPPQKKEPTDKEGFLEKSGILPPHPLCSFLMVRPLFILRRRRQLLVKTKQTNKQTKTENVVMINGRSNDGH